jgi:4-amino-4-deoxy-L-arabinose transferase-like glycosyltransferase
VSGLRHKGDLLYAALLVIWFGFGLAVSWQRWGNLLVDCGREMNQPLRLAAGQMLYSEVRHIYGPLSPYLNAALYRAFGPSVEVLYAGGIITAAIILALVYWIGRQLMGRLESFAAALSVMWLCAFKPAGNYILPYSFSALHGCALGLTALALLIGFIGRSGQLWYMVAAGFVAGLAVLAKTETGLPALAAGIAAAALVGAEPRRSLKLAILFAAPALGAALSVYGYIAWRVGLKVLLYDSFLLPQNLPPELVYFNKKMFGFDDPLRSLVNMIGAALRLAALVAFIAALSAIISRRRSCQRQVELIAADAGRISLAQLWAVLLVSMAAFASLSLAGREQWDKGPYMAMPLLLLFMLVVAFKRAGSKGRIILIVTTVYALMSLARALFRVRSGGAYSSYLLPASVVLFVYFLAEVAFNFMQDGRARWLARRLAIWLIIVDAVATAAILAQRYQKRNTYRISTERGTIMTAPDLGRAFDQALEFIARETAPGDPVAVLPEGTSLLFLANRRNPLREEITTPGYLDAAGEERAIEQLIKSGTKVILIANRPTPEFGRAVFGRDYCRNLMGWIEANFQVTATFGGDRDPQIGDREFFIRAYQRRVSSSRSSS